ncbi:uncharacterized protein CDAR_41661 [Caerostris darwini]|uniref:Ig-like domain-containing protein n=1 Tax=Caerostris darwini TaxID=1538125 RepID=A0AAV4NEJ3_9ARAC|nr:uncharacterized protein CDAR_41661 [Caerostris darwini]
MTEKGLSLRAHLLEDLLLLIGAFVSVLGSHRPVPPRIVALHVPSPAVAGDSAVLRCGYELGGETLYAVKWYRNAAEFYRYVPASRTPIKTFLQAGIDVDVSKSEKSSVYLRNLSLESFGNYTCQVSTDKPYFRCVQTTRHLVVVVPPWDGPVLMEEKSDYELGDNVSILCNSGKSKPAPELKWYINGQLVDISIGVAFRPPTVFPTRGSEGFSDWVKRYNPKLSHRACPALFLDDLNLLNNLFLFQQSSRIRFAPGAFCS